MKPISVQDAFRQGEPLVELWIRFREGVDYHRATELLDGLGPDIDVGLGEWYSPDTRCAHATASAMLRLFNTQMQRVAIFPEFPECYSWLPDTIVEWPQEMAGLIAQVGLTQPGGYDDGQPFPTITEQDGTSNGG